MTQILVFSLATSLLFTVIIEVGFFFIVGKRNKKDLLLLVLVNVITNPLVVLLYYVALMFTEINLILVIVVLELLAVLIEGRYYQKYGIEFRNPYIFSLVANVCSYGIGALVQHLF